MQLHKVLVSFLVLTLSIINYAAAFVQPAEAHRASSFTYQSQDSSFLQYTDTEHGFSFLYPEDLTYVKWRPTQDILSSVSLLLPAAANEYHSDQAPDVSVTVFSNPNRLEAVEWLQSHENIEYLGSSDVEGETSVQGGEGNGFLELTIDHRKAVLFRQTFLEGAFYRLIIPNGKEITSIVVADLEKEQLLSAFKSVIASIRWHPEVPAINQETLELLDRTLVPSKLPDSSLQATPDAMDLVGYKLPYPAGVAYSLTRGWYPGGHPNNESKYAYDFGMAEGNVVVASRSGVVSHATGQYIDCGGSGYANYGNRVVINHDDGTATLYLHLSRVERHHESADTARTKRWIVRKDGIYKHW